MTFEEWLETDNAKALMSSEECTIKDVMEATWITGHTQGVLETLEDYKIHIKKQEDEDS
jgi:hypothetical protein